MSDAVAHLQGAARHLLLEGLVHTQAEEAFQLSGHEVVRADLSCCSRESTNPEYRGAEGVLYADDAHSGKSGADLASQVLLLGFVAPDEDVGMRLDADHVLLVAEVHELGELFCSDPVLGVVLHGGHPSLPSVHFPAVLLLADGEDIGVDHVLAIQQRPYRCCRASMQSG